MARTITHEELDLRLSAAARDPERFAQRARELAAELDQNDNDHDGFDIELEVKDPSSWRKELKSSSRSTDRVASSIEDQFRDEVDKLLHLDRDEEGQLARRIEFARIRLELALEHHGLTLEDLEGGVSASPSLSPDTLAPGCECSLPERVCKRWNELHGTTIAPRSCTSGFRRRSRSIALRLSAPSSARILIT